MEDLTPAWKKERGKVPLSLSSSTTTRSLGLWLSSSLIYHLSWPREGSHRIGRSRGGHNDDATLTKKKYNLQSVVKQFRRRTGDQSRRRARRLTRKFYGLELRSIVYDWSRAERRWRHTAAWIWCENGMGCGTCLTAERGRELKADIL